MGAESTYGPRRRYPYRSTRIISRRSHGRCRGIASRPLSRSLPSYGSAPAVGLELVTGYDPFNMRHYQRYMDVLEYNQVREPRAAVWTDIAEIRRFDLLAALNVGYVISPQPIEVPSDYALVASLQSQPQFRFYEGVKTGPVYVYRNRQLTARAFFVSLVVPARDEAAADRALKNVNVKDTAIVDVRAPAGMSPSEATDFVDVSTSTAGALSLSAQNAHRRFLVVSEIWHPGWRATIDGHPTSLYQTDIALQGLWLEPGFHNVELHYWPPGLTVGAIVTALTLIAVVGLLLGQSRRARQQPRARQCDGFIAC